MNNLYIQRMISERESKAQEYLSKGDAEKNRITAETDRKVKELSVKSGSGCGSDSCRRGSRSGKNL